MSGKNISREEGAQMPGVVPNRFKSNTRKAEAREPLLVQCQPGLHNEFWSLWILYLKTITAKKEKKKKTELRRPFWSSFNLLIFIMYNCIFRNTAWDPVSWTLCEILTSALEMMRKGELLNIPLYNYIINYLLNACTFSRG